MSDYELAQLKRTVEKTLKAQGLSNRDARIRVSSMSIVELLAIGKPNVSQRIKRVFGWN
jgi:hypothetical protein